MFNDDTKYEGEAKQREVNSPEPKSHVSERPQPLIHIEAGVSFLVGILIFRHKRGLFVLVFRAVYAIAFLVFVGLTFPCHSIGREFGGKGTKLTWTLLGGNDEAQYPPKTHESLSRMRAWTEIILRNQTKVFNWIWSMSMLATWLIMSRTGIKRGVVAEPRPNQSRFPVRWNLALEISFDTFLKGVRYALSLTHNPGYPKLESWSANYTHYLQTCITERLLSNTSGSSTHSTRTRAGCVKVWDTCNRADGRGS